MIEKLCGEANVDAKDVIIAYLEKKVQELESQLYDASIQIQELIEQDIWCPSNCEKLKKLQQQCKKQKECIDKLKEYISSQMIAYDDGEDCGVDCECDGFKLLDILKGSD